MECIRRDTEKERQEESAYDDLTEMKRRGSNSRS